MLKHKFGVENKVDDALIRICCLLQTMAVEVIGFDKLKNAYASSLMLALSIQNFGPVIVDPMSTLFSMMVICSELLNYVSPGLHSETP